MALFEQSRPVVADQGFGARLASLVPGFVAAFTAWNDARMTRNALSRLSDHELDDLGITRGDIEGMFR